tara:strand:- start:3100 stop:3642 length:543 start_codon:yes stop_codon:yes gene_type:complete
MSQKALDVVRGIAQAAANAYDGALDEKGEPLKVGLRREEGNPITDSRVVDGFKVRIDGSRLVVLYQSDIKLRDVYSTNYEDVIESAFSDIVKYLKKEYKKITGNTLSLKEAAEADILIQKTSKVRVWCQATKVYKIGGLDDVVDRLEPTEDRLDSSFREFLGLGGLGKKAENKNQRAPQK